MSTVLRSSVIPASAANRVALLAALAGAAVSVYLTVQHYDSDVSFACPQSATINCEKVTTSTYSSIAGIPVALLGLIFFAAMSALLLPSVRGRVVPALRVGGAAAGVLMVLWLVYVELFEVDAICLWCTAVHVLTLVLFAATLWGQLDAAEPD
jgi:uncharacterized membrane protein